MHLIHISNLLPGVFDDATTSIKEQGIFIGPLTEMDKWNIGRSNTADGYVSIELSDRNPSLVKAMPNFIAFPYDHPISIARDEKSRVEKERARVAALAKITPHIIPANMIAERSASIIKKTGLELNGVNNPEIDYKNGIKAADIITLNLCAEGVGSIMGSELRVPTIGSERLSVLESLAKFKLEGNTLTTIIDTGKMNWTGLATETSFNAYTKDTKQGVKLGRGRIAEVDGSVVGNEAMVLGDGRKVTLWFAAVGDKLSGRYDIISKASALMTGYDSARNAESTKRIIPAVDLRLKNSLPEIVAANEDVITRVEQEIKFALDYTGARAAATTSMTIRGSSPSQLYVFGAKSPVMYWLSEPDNRELPFAVTISTPEAWLNVGQRPDFTV